MYQTICVLSKHNFVIHPSTLVSSPEASSNEYICSMFFILSAIIWVRIVLENWNCKRMFQERHTPLSSLETYCNCPESDSVMSISDTVGPAAHSVF